MQPFQPHQITEIQIEREQIQIDPGEILRLLGYDRKNHDALIEETLKKCLQKSKPLIDPRACFVIIPKSSHGTRGEIKLRNVIFKVDNIIFPNFKYADFVALFVATAGGQIGKAGRELLANNEMLDGYVMDLIGSEMAEQVAETVHKKIEESVAANEMKITNRFSPGYCNWDVEEQFKLFSFFNGNTCGVSLTDSALMDPVKSVSGMVGIGKNVRFRQYKCSICGDENCIYRKRD